jgi:hypothetical protein
LVTSTLQLNEHFFSSSNDICASYHSRKANNYCSKQQCQVLQLHWHIVEHNQQLLTALALAITVIVDAARATLPAVCRCQRVTAVGYSSADIADGACIIRVGVGADNGASPVDAGLRVAIACVVSASKYSI